MNRPVMFVQSLGVLLMAIHVTSACQCASMLQWEKVMCPQYNKTVVEGKIEGARWYDALGNAIPDDEGSIAGGLYNMTLIHIYKNGTNPLAVHNGTFLLQFPYDDNLCGTPLGLGDYYIIGGLVDTNGTLHSNLCILLLDSSTSRNDRNQMNILTGVQELNCQGS